MIAESLARRYASALYNLAMDENILDVVFEEFSAITKLIETHNKFRYFLISPKIPTAEKKNVLQSIFGTTVSGTMLHFLFVVLDKKRQTLLSYIYSHFSSLYDNYCNRTDVLVRTAVELDSGLGDVIKQAFETKLNKTISVKRQIDPSLIGGIQIRIGNTIYDASVKKHLSMMKQLLLQQG